MCLEGVGLKLFDVCAGNLPQEVVLRAFWSALQRQVFRSWLPSFRAAGTSLVRGLALARMLTPHQFIGDAFDETKRSLPAARLSKVMLQRMA